MDKNRLPNSVLVVDDSAVQRQFAVELCQRLGIHEIYQAEDGLQAIQTLQQNPSIETMILDLEMPTMDGVQVLHELVNFTKKPAVVVASSREEVLLNVVESIGKNLGVCLLGVLGKPLTYEVLQDSLGRFALCHPVLSAQDSSSNALHLGPADIERALQNNEFISYFQPKVTLRAGAFTGVETLIRWQHPQHGLLEPAAFIEIIEDSSYLSAVTLQMLDNAIHYCQQWHASALPLKISVNLSSHSLRDTNLADSIIARIKQSSLAADAIIFEITETALMTDLGISQGTLARLRLNGFGLSIDDYGTGFSGMLQLAQVPCSELKIDRAFVNGASQQTHLRVLLESALDIARKFKLTVVAEGVETLADWQLLRELECDEVQGYFIAKPMPGEALLPWWRSNQTRIKAL